jgi:hypothetical protein
VRDISVIDCVQLCVADSAAVRVAVCVTVRVTGFAALCDCVLCGAWYVVYGVWCVVRECGVVVCVMGCGGWCVVVVLRGGVVGGWCSGWVMVVV